MAKKVEKILAYSELGLAVLLGVLCVLEFKVTFFPSQGIHWEAPGWALIGLMVLTPFAVSFGVAGWTLFRRGKGKWLYQLLPALVVIGVGIFFWWADRGSL